MAQNLTEIKTLLEAWDLRPKHRLGQNFLHDANKMAAIVNAASILPGQVVLEVGAGTGALSERLLDAGAELIAVEMDQHLEPILRQRLADYAGRVNLLMTDVLASKHKLSPVVAEALGAVSALKLVANLPYSIASPLIANLLLDYPQMTLAVVTVQREVAQRMLASPGSKAYGPLGILVQSLCCVEPVTKLSPACFWPRPKVESQVLRLCRRDVPLTSDPQALARLLQQLFSSRRKQLGTILGRDRPWPEGVQPSQRPEQLSVEQLIALSGRH
jgi:16S rRNA (adenine1518-N6/adenine1519-N6)-dimethyltransferase